MSQSTWSVQDAKNRFSAVIEAAKREPQTVTKHGKPAVVVVEAERYAKLAQLERIAAPRFNDHLLAFPGDADLERLQGSLRESDL